MGEYVEYFIGRHMGHIGKFLVLDADTRKALPPETGPDTAEEDWFDAEILDLETGITHKAKHDYIAYEPVDGGCTVHQYLYSGHWCGCHRIDAIEKCGCRIQIHGDDEDDKCPRGRFVVKKMWHRSMPDKILFYETPINASHEVGDVGDAGGVSDLCGSPGQSKG